MVLTDARYALRLASGERAGDAVPIPADGLTVGRGPGNGLRLAETSVSGRHAELSVGASGVTLRDLGSTNGTFVGGERVEERVLVHGDEVRFGNLKATFVDRSLVEEPAVEAAPEGEAVHTVGTERVRATGRRGPLGPVLLVLVLLGGGAAAFLLLRSDGGGAGGGGPRTPVVAVEGNLLDDASFEGEAATWTAADAAPARFYRDGSHRRSGDVGLGVELAEGEWARSVSPEVDPRARRGLALSAAVEVTGGAEACVGVELAAAADDRASFVAWGPTLRETGGFADVALTVPALPGYDRARVVVEARGGAGGGAVAVDDVALVEVDPPAPAATFEDDELLLDDHGRNGALVHVTEVLLSGLRLREPGGDGPRWTAGTLSASATANGARIALDAEPDAVLELRAHLSEDPFLATTGAEGFRAYGASFEDVRASALLCGSGARLLRLGFDREVTFEGTLADGVLRVAIDPAGATACDLQLGFREERQAALDLAAEARDLSRSNPGAGVAAWTRLLDEYPFETRLVEEAEAARAELLQTGQAALIELREEFERARFFGLADLFRRTRDEVLALAERYAGTEVAEEAAELAAAIEAEREALAGDRRAFERRRLEAVSGVLADRGWEGLAARVRAAIKDAPADGERE